MFEKHKISRTITEYEEGSPHHFFSQQTLFRDPSCHSKISISTASAQWFERKNSGSGENLIFCSVIVTDFHFLLLVRSGCGSRS